MTFFKRQKNGVGLGKNAHRHVFRDTPNQRAYWQKRDCPGDGILFAGTLRECACGHLRFQVPGLREVEVTQ